MGGEVSLITLAGVSVRLGGDTILSDVSVNFGRGERWGIVGRNGTGKTTLFRLITGQLQPAAGSVSRLPGLRIVLLDQHRDFDGATTVWDAAAEPFAHLRELERSLAEQAAALAEDPSPKAMARYDRDLERFEREGGYTYAARVDAVLQGLGFDPADARTRPLETLSGGERGRIGLARQLVAPADVYLFDEPTNHLDLETTRWLEEYLRALDATILVISHDRAFLDAIVDHVLHLEGGTAIPYTGGYSSFVVQRAERRLAQQRAYEQQQRVIVAEEEFIRRNIAGQNSRQARGRRTRLARLPRLSPPPPEEAVMALRLKAEDRGGDQVLVAENVRLTVPASTPGGAPAPGAAAAVARAGDAAERTIVESFSTRLARGEVVGLVGPNGAGKSTLLRAIVGEHPVASGELRLGASIRVAYYRQDLAQVPADRTLYEAIHDLRPQWDRGQVQGHLGRFGFSGDEVHRRAGSLSGGEQARLALAMIMLSGANLILFDEPTNHLDVETVEALEDAIDAYDGTVILVSHDRALLRALTTRVWAIRDGRAEVFEGGFAEWEVVQEERARARAEAEAAQEAARRERERRAAAAARREEQMAEKQRRAALREARRRVEVLEARIAELERRVAELTAALEDPTLYSTAEGSMRAYELKSQLDAAKRELDAALEEWAEAGEALEALAAR